MNENETMEEYAARMKLYLENRHNVSPDELFEKYGGKCIAWGPDGTTIVASADDYDLLADTVSAAGFDPAHCVFDFIEVDSAI